jgi:hypothetical protein
MLRAHLRIERNTLEKESVRIPIMTKYLVQLKSSIYFDVEIEAPDDEKAEELGIEQLAELLDSVKLPMPLEFDAIEMWQIQENEDEL